MTRRLRDVDLLALALVVPRTVVYVGVGGVLWFLSMAFMAAFRCVERLAKVGTTAPHTVLPAAFPWEVRRSVRLPEPPEVSS